MFGPAELFCSLQVSSSVKVSSSQRHAAVVWLLAFRYSRSAAGEVLEGEALMISYWHTFYVGLHLPARQPLLCMVFSWYASIQIVRQLTISTGSVGSPVSPGSVVCWLRSPSSPCSACQGFYKVASIASPCLGHVPRPFPTCEPMTP